MAKKRQPINAHHITEPEVGPGPEGEPFDVAPPTPRPIPARAVKKQPAAGLEYPTVKYRKRPVSDKYPNGYESRVVNTPEADAALNPDEWKDSPADLDGAE